MSASRGPAGSSRRYSLEEANALLPEMRRLLTDMRRATTGLDELRQRLKGEDGHIHLPESDTHVPVERFHLVALFDRTVTRVHELGVELKDAQRGLVDFPSASGDEECYLCWQEGEEFVKFFHGLETGFAGRRPIDELVPNLLPVRDADDESEEG